LPYNDACTVVETRAFVRSADNAGMTEAERSALVEMLAQNPSAGDLIVGSGGCRKLRLAGRGKGKSGGYRVITFFVREDRPVYLLWTFSKGSQANLTKAQVNELAAIAKTLARGVDED
jgi:hypothetical protein